MGESLEDTEGGTTPGISRKFFWSRSTEARERSRKEPAACGSMTTLQKQTKLTRGKRVNFQAKKFAHTKYRQCRCGFRRLKAMLKSLRECGQTLLFTLTGLLDRTTVSGTYWSQWMFHLEI